jgi:hypothetical protein
MKLAHRAEEIVQGADAYYQQHEVYPANAKELKTVWTKFKNPYTDELDEPNITAVEYGSDKDDAEADALRAKFYADMASGDFWKDKELGAGEIACCSATFKSSRGPINAFIATAAGADGEVFHLGNEQPALYFVTEDGRPPKQQVPKGETVTSVWISKRPLDAGLLFWFKEAAWMAFLIGAIAFLCLGLSASKKDASKGLWIFASIAMGIVGCLYFVFSRMH